MDNLFDFTPSKTADDVIAAAMAAQATPRTKLRVDYFDNTKVPGKASKLYGIVLNIDDDNVRYNINFGVQTLQDIVDAYANPFTSNAARENLNAMATRWAADGLGSNPHAYMATGKLNKRHTNSAKDHGQKSGKGTEDHRIGAVCVVDAHGAPWVCLFLEGAAIELSGWKKVPKSSSETLEWRVVTHV